MSGTDGSERAPLTDEAIKSERQISRRTLLASTGVAIASITSVVAVTAERVLASNKKDLPVGLKDSDLKSGDHEKVAIFKDNFDLCSPKDPKGGNRNSVDTVGKDTNSKTITDCTNKDSVS